MRTSVWIAVAFLLACFAPDGRGQSLESLVMPGAVTQSHAKIEHECGKCHTRFAPGAQPRLCLDCHRDVAGDVRAGGGYHGKIKERQCRKCHTDHKGRDAKTVVLDEKKFDHRLTDFLLRGRHQAATCASCHRPGRKHRDAPGDCFGCHRGNDAHRGNLGTRCDSCHDEHSWRKAFFDHGKTRFPLLHRHQQVRCNACHIDERYAGTPRECVACHKNDDTHKGSFGARCETCHSEQDWKAIHFRHDRDAGYPLVGRHSNLQCTSCHRGPLYRDKLPTQCVACHRQDDAHKSVLGERCNSCHTPDNWQRGRFDHDVNTPFPLKDKHRSVKCESCHREPGLKDKPPQACVGCHRRDDMERGHQGRYGGRCETCHQEQSWRTIKFDHERDTRFPRNGKHRSVRCDACHRNGLYGAKTEDRCYACHKHDDIHFGSFEERCDHCHLADDWRKIIKAASDKHCQSHDTPPRRPAGKTDAPAAAFWIPDCAAPAGKDRKR